jgi:orotidine-5'-phosphate decarboxylase
LSLIVALDFSELEPCKKIIEELKGLVKIYKVGYELFTAHGWKAVELVQNSGADVFLDLKLHDIPTTVGKASGVIAERGVFMFNVHALGGLQMMSEARKAVDRKSGKGGKPLLVAVTVLTSLNETELFKELGVGRSLKDEVLALAQLAKKAGLDGVVCSPQEIELLRASLGKDFLLVTPGIRPKGSDKNDQQRSLTPAEAIRLGASYLVVGRPVTASSNPRQVVQNFFKDAAAL